MKPIIEKRDELKLVGLVTTGKSVKEIDIPKTWKKFTTIENQIKNKADAEVGYEIHIVDEKSEIPIHFCFVGIEVKKYAEIPIELFAKTIPKGKYAIFTHSFKNGGFGEAFKNAYQWIKDSEYSSGTFDIQCYDERYQSPNDPESIITIMIPLE